MDLKKFAKKAQKKKKPLTAFLKKLDKIVPEDFQSLVAEEDKKMWEKVDCLECANCCKTMTPTYSTKDIKRIAAHFDMTPKEFKKKWLYQEEDTKDWMNTSTPCQFLGKDNKCSIYEIRPVDCAEFPHHNKKDFEDYNDTFIQNVHRCPATYELVNSLKKRVEREYEW
ncbi:MAG: YkgJ family cysteine cluster protein [Flavipsychrobacter sp.]